MKCNVCEQEIVGKHPILFGFGAVCADECEQIAKGRIDAHHEELRNESLGSMPEAFETADFERWSLKLAVHIIHGLSEEQRRKLEESNPFMLFPIQLSLELKDKIIRHIPHRYVPEVEARGHERMLHGGTYCFRQPVPCGVIVKACKKAGIFQ